MSVKTILLLAPAAAMLAACSMFSVQDSNCITQTDGAKVCSLTHPALGLTTRTVERGDKLYVSTCQMSQCTPFEELPTGQMPPAKEAPPPREQ